MFRISGQEVNYIESKSDNIKDLLHKILIYVRTITKADAGTIYLENNNHLHFNIFQNDSIDEEKKLELDIISNNLTIPIKKNSQILSVESFITCETIIIDDVYTNEEYDFHATKEFDSTFSYSTKSILSTPLVNFFTGEKIGVLQVINKKCSKSNNNICFTKEDKRLISVTSYLITLNILYTQNLIFKLKEANTNLEEKVAQRTQELKIIQEELINQANKDSLTDLYNRRYFNEVINNLISISKRQDISICICMIDIDNFKSINDTYGHNIGDEVLKYLSDIFKTSIRNSDIAIRFGGEEFIIVLPNTSMLAAEELLDHIRVSISNKIFSVNDIDINLTVSVGISKINENENNVHKALIRADKALYVSKNQGKNQVNIQN